MHGVKDDGNLVRRGRRGGGRAEFGFHAAEVVAHRRLIAMQPMRSQSEQSPGAVLGSAGASPQHFSSADVVVGAQSKPGNEMPGGGPFRHVPSYFAEQHEDQGHQSGNL